MPVDCSSKWFLSRLPWDALETKVETLIDKNIQEVKFTEPKIGYWPLDYYMQQHDGRTPEQEGKGHQRTMIDGVEHVIVPEAPIKYIKKSHIRQAFASCK